MSNKLVSKSMRELIIENVFHGETHFQVIT